MKKLFVMMMASFILLSACQSNKELAESYRLELQYYENSVRFMNLTMIDEAYMSCKETDMLRSECFTTLVQQMLARNLDPAKEFCDEIDPSYRMPMTIDAFYMAYQNVSEDLKKEFIEKRKPSEERQRQIRKIKEECLT